MATVVSVLFLESLEGLGLLIATWLPWAAVVDPVAEAAESALPRLPPATSTVLYSVSPYDKSMARNDTPTLCIRLSSVQ